MKFRPLFVGPLQTIHTNSVIEVQLISNGARLRKLGLCLRLAHGTTQIQSPLCNLRSKTLAFQQGAQSFRTGVTKILVGPDDHASFFR